MSDRMDFQTRHRPLFPTHRRRRALRLAAWRQYTDAAEAEAWPAFKVVETLTQVVAGTNYFFKVRVSAEGSAEEFVHLRVFSSLFGADPELAAMLKGKDGLGPLQYF